MVGHAYRVQVEFETYTITAYTVEQAVVEALTRFQTLAISERVLRERRALLESRGVRLTIRVQRIR